MTAQPHTSRRVLVVASQTVESPALAEAIGSDLDTFGIPQVLVVAPALNSRLRHWASDDRAAQAAAEDRLRRFVEQLAAFGVEAEGVVGDADPLQAAADALHLFPADELVIATDAEPRSNWLARDVVARARRTFDVPVTHVIADEDDAYGPASVSRGRLLALAGAAGATLVAGSKVGGQLWSELGASLGTEPAAAADARALACVLTPEKTEGPYFVDERLNRSDIRGEPSGGSAQDGVPLRLRLRVYDAERSCAPVAGAAVDIWHADAAGLYSDVSANGTVGRKFLRGYQITDASGSVEFLTVYPGWYRGRAIHIHFKVRTFDGRSETSEFTSQLFFQESANAAVLARSPYSARGAADTPNGSDNIYGSDGSQLLGALVSDGAGGYVSTYDVGLSELPSRSGADTAVNASLAATRWTRTSSGSRLLQLTLDLDETVSAELRLLRAGRTIVRRRYASLSAGTRRATLPIGGGVASGGARLRLALEDAAENTRVVQRAVQVPRRAS